MSIMRALKNVGIGYLQGTTDIMAQKAAQKREDEKLAADREFEFKLQKDRILQTKLANIEIENLKNTNKTNADKIKDEKFIKDKREQLRAQGYTVPMLDVLEEQGYLKSDSAFGIYFNKYNPYMFDRTGSPDWHTSLDSNGMSFQDLYVQEYGKFIGGDTTTFNMSSVLQENNNMSKNTVDSQLEGFAPSLEDEGSGASGIQQQDKKPQNILELPAGSPQKHFLKLYEQT